MKTCSKCFVVKGAAEFNLDSSKKDGLYPSCKECRNSLYGVYRINNRENLNKRAKERRDKDIERYRKNARDYRARNRTKISKQSSNWYKNNKEKVRGYYDRTYNDNKHKRDAMRSVYLALKNNIIKRPLVCHKCLKRCKPDAHHRNYKKPLDITWLCRVCHKRLHQEERVLLNSCQPTTKG